MDETQSGAMRNFYARVDAALAALTPRPHCNACGECCHFDTADHILYASGLERKFLLAVAPPPGAPAAAQRCPYQQDNRCLAGTARTLGCRIHFCGWNDTPEESDFAEKWHAELQALHAALGEPWDYRPLLPL